MTASLVAFDETNAFAFNMSDTIAASCSAAGDSVQPHVSVNDVGILGPPTTSALFKFSGGSRDFIRLFCRRVCNDGTVIREHLSDRYSPPS